MGRVVARVSGPQKPEDVLLDVFALSFLTIIIAAYTANVGLYLSIALGVIDGVLFIMMLRRIVVATFTVDGLVIGRGGRRGRVFIPRDVVVAGNVVCIERDSRGRSYNMRVAYGGRVYTISLMNKRLVDKMVDRLRRNWGWVPPECPST
ncbi:hypothetical protein [Vulcanisaeta sp. EB80]|uniref:hypothetical protein n=1 Tax=Vulcanisaeta sp. EB80 TaxID=1650660 RepID=UPI001181396B|nr:hypothetical protein [Vulcanisaeta sp. EB80]